MIVFSVPGKTFLAGEYLAMEGGLALLALTAPRFELRVRDGSGDRSGFPAGSPAVLFMDRHAEAFADCDLEFVDPHAGAGGWGASTAQYLMVYACFHRSRWQDEIHIDTKDLLENYREDAWNGEGRAPSGADLIGQMKGGFTFFDRNAGLIAKTIWPFPGLEGYLVRTGVKVPTHEHLRGLANAEFHELAPLMGQLREAWNASREDDFVQSLNAFSAAVRARGFTVPTTEQLLAEVGRIPGVRAAKGCGALGADVLFVVTAATQREAFEAWARAGGRQITRLGEHISAGLEVGVSRRPAASLEGTL